MTNMTTVTIEYFAVLREHAGCEREEVTTAAPTARALYAELAERHGFPELSSVKVALNDAFSDWDAVLADGDRVVYIPPVAGG